MGMKSKTIKGVIKRKFDDWCSSIEDDSVRNLVKDNTIVTGGCIASMLLGEQVNDYDVYFRNRETALAVAKYYVNKFNSKSKTVFKDQPTRTVNISIDESSTDRVKIIVKSAGIACEEGADNYQYFEGALDPSEAGEYVEQVMETGTSVTTDERPKYRPVFLSTNAITLSDKIQLVLRFYGEPDQLHENYDFVHCMNYWDSKGVGELFLKSEALECLLSKELRYIGSKYPICSVIRTRKFINRGWKINAGQYLKMAMQISNLNLNDVSVLEDQLTGVDVAYFHEVLSQLKERDKTNVDSTYLMEIINRMF